MYFTSVPLTLAVGLMSIPSAVGGRVYHRYSFLPRDDPQPGTAGAAAAAGAVAAGIAAGVSVAGLTTGGSCNVTFNMDADATFSDNCPESFDTLDQLSTACDKLTPDCRNRYIIATMSKELGAAMDNYTDILKDGYDDKFNTYQQYIKDLVPVELKNWMAANASKSGYWECMDQQKANCCSKCGATDVSCFSGCNNDADCKDGWANKTIPCPTERAPDEPRYFSQVTDSPDAMWYTLKNEDGFYKDIDTVYGIDKSWVHQVDLTVATNPGCDASTLGHPCDSNIYWHGFPDRAQFDVPNPKDTVQKALGNYTQLRNMLSDAAVAAEYSMIGDATSDVIDAASLPLFMLQQALDAMASIVKEADQIDEEKKKEMAMGFVMGVLMLLPAIGELADVAGLAMLARVISLTSDVGDVATGIYGADEDPKNAVWALFGAFALGGRAWKEGAAARRGMSAEQLAKLGPSIQAKANKLDKLTIKCM